MTQRILETPLASRRLDWAAPRLALVALVTGLLVLWFGTLGLRHLVPSDEGRYAEIAREMVVSGDWVTIRYNGLQYFEKPPLHLWITALAYEAFGVGDWQARVCSALAGLLGIGAMALAARRWYGNRIALLCALVLVATPTWVFASHFNSLDITVSAAMACALAALLIAQHPDADARTRWRWMAACWIAMGAAILAKGLIGLALPGLVLVIYTAVSRDLRLWTRLHVCSGLVLMLAVTAPWFLLISSRNPAFAEFFFIHEHWTRFTSNEHHRAGPLWYFVPLLVAGFLPWTVIAPRLVRVVADEPRGGFRPLLMCAVWSIAIFVFFSVSGSKLPGYIVPVFPALALITAVALERIDARGLMRLSSVLLVLAGLGLCATPLISRGSHGTPYHHLLPVFSAWVAGALVLLFLGLLAMRSLVRSGNALASLVVLSVAMTVGTTAAMTGYEPLGRQRAGVDLVPAMQSVLKPDMPLYSVRMLDHTLPFYLRRTTTLVEMPDELEFGVTQEPDKWIPDMPTFMARWSAGPPAMAIMSPETYEWLQARHLPMTRIADDARRIVVVNPARRDVP